LGKNNGIIPVAYREITLPWQEKNPPAAGHYPVCCSGTILSFDFPGLVWLFRPEALIFQSPDTLIYS
jgi:hypothetical protein